MNFFSKFFVFSALALSPLANASDEATTQASTEQNTTDIQSTLSTQELDRRCGAVRYEWSQYGQVQYCWLVRSVWAPQLGQCEWNRQYVVNAWYCQ